MAYARMGQDSDVYVYKAADFECAACILEPPFQTFKTRHGIQAHLEKHLRAGHKVPASCFERLALEMVSERTGTPMPETPVEAAIREYYSCGDQTCEWYGQSHLHEEHRSPERVPPVKLILEMQRPDHTWGSIGRPLSVDDEPGSFSTIDTFGARQVYVFGWRDGAGPALWRSVGGMDDDSHPVRHLFTAGLVLVADLTEGPHEMVWVRKAGGSAPIRLRVEAS